MMMMMIKEMREYKGTKENKEVGCMKCKNEGHSRANCAKKSFCDICKVLGHTIKQCPYNLKVRTSNSVDHTAKTH